MAEDALNDDELEELTVLGLGLITAIFQRKPLPEIKALIADGAPLWFQDDEGTSALHAAAYIEDHKLIQHLIEKGAVWNSVDNLHCTAGDIALSLNNETCYQIIREAGIRSEMLLSLLSSRSGLPSSIFLKVEDDTAIGSTDAFLSSRLKYTRDQNGQEICLLDAGDGQEVGVMMGWERGLMQETVRLLCDNHRNLARGLKVLNIGFGLGIIDELFQSLSTPPLLHVIIEAHPDVQAYMREHGWYEKPGVQVLEGKWQDVIENPAVLEVGGFDVIYTDTFSEDYEELHRFFRQVPDLLSDSESRFSFFNGLGATNALFYDIYTNVSELHLSDLGIETQWHQVDVVVQAGQDRWGTSREYFAMRLYQLPIGNMRKL